ncbi:hypothetical protein ACS0TY_017798 [Phlomoides rotata]
MASSTKLTVVERCDISPPPRSLPPVSLPLTFFDIPWLLFSPTQPLFFYDLPTNTPNFIKSTLPKLKRSLSLSLQQFFPLAGKLVMPSAVSAGPHLEFAENDSISLTVAAAETGAFKNLAVNHGRIGRDFHCLVPPLPASELLSVQITVFPESGICIGFTWRNVVADWRTFNNFLSAWASLYKSGGTGEAGRHVAFYDRSVIFDPSELGSTFLKEWFQIKNSGKECKEFGSTYDTIRATFMLGPKDMEQIKKWIVTRAELLFGSTQLLLTPYVVVCAFIWACWMKAKWSKNEGQNVVHYFGFIAGGMTRLRYTVPKTYVGNCVGFGRSSATRRDLIGENGVVYAAKAIGDTIKKLNEDIMMGAQNWISEWKTIRESDLHVMITGSPKVGLYELDFGWGKPVKFEEVSIDTTNAISLNDSREVIGGIEIGVALPKSKMDAFTVLFSKGLNRYFFVNDS